MFRLESRTSPLRLEVLDRWSAVRIGFRVLTVRSCHRARGLGFAGSATACRDDGGVRGQAERDVQTVTIATALALFVLVLVAAGVVALLAEWVADPSARFWQALEIAAFAVASGLSLRYLVRHRRP